MITLAALGNGHRASLLKLKNFKVPSQAALPFTIPVPGGTSPLENLPGMFDYFRLCPSSDKDQAGVCFEPHRLIYNS